jgi:hypothetical protein
LLALLIHCVAATPAFALFMELKEPDVALPASYPDDVRKQVSEALRRPDCKFLRGFGLNSHTSLFYEGDTKALNQFLSALVKCPGTSLHVSFAAKPAADESCDWMVSHDAMTNGFHVIVSLKSARVKLEDLYLPDMKGPPAKRIPAGGPPKLPAK